MKTLPVPQQAPQCAADCYDWLTPTDVVRHALAAFYAVCRYYDRGETTYGPETYLPPDSRAQLADDIAEVLNAKLHDQGFKAQALGFHGWASETHAWWLPATSDDAPARSAEYVDNSTGNHHGNPTGYTSSRI